MQQPPDTTRAPVVRVEDAEITRIIDVSDTGIYQPVHFKTRISWIRDASARVVVRLADSGRELRSGSTFNEFFGLGSSPRECLKEVGRYVEEYDTVPGGKRVAEIEFTTTESPVVVVPSREHALAGTTTYYPVKSDWFRRNDAVINEWLKLSFNDRFDHRPDHYEPLVKTHIFWSSEWINDTREVQLARMADIIRPYLEGTGIDLAARIGQFAEQLPGHLAAA